MAAVDDVKSYMDFWGWDDGGAPGSVKRDFDGTVIAHHGDATWIADVEKACAILRRLSDALLQER